MKPINNQRGIVGLVLLAAVMVVAILGAGYYVYQVRTGQETAVTATSTVKKANSAIKKDEDAAAADKAGQEADSENLNDLEVTDADLQ